MNDEHTASSSENEDSTAINDEQVEITTKKPSSKTKLIGLLLFLSLLFVGGSYFLSKNKLQEKELDLKRAQTVSDSLYHELKNTLAIYKQEHEDLYVQIVRKESVLESQYAKIKRLIAQAKRDKVAQKTIRGKLQNLQLELNNLQNYVDNQTLDLEELRVENKRLKKEKAILDALYTQELETKRRLQTEDSLLQSENQLLQQKINTASVLRVQGIQTQLMRIKGNGEQKKVLLAKNAEVLDVCFDLIPNEICEAGTNRFFLRIINPKGTVLFDSNRGSAKLRLFQEDVEIAYSSSKIFDYNKALRQMCLQWYAYPNSYFLAGTYRIEIYNKGRLVGQSSFSSK